ncbi:corrinoid protein [Candidatus Leptofilum sp.]|uniref:corrinoid protein n=1 Tax=Candidatus Leptofilum sp. TaxID=3241576 RepID=UPI003B58BDE0
MQAELETLYEGILDGDMSGTPDNVQTALDAGLDPDVILKEGMIAAMGEVGELFEEGEYFVPEMLISAKAMQAGLGILRPHLVASGVDPIGKALLGTVQGDMHDIGKNLVGMMLEGAGFEVIDLGIDVSPQTFIEAINEHQPQVMGMSALLTTTMPKMKVTIDAMRDAGVLDSVKVMVGGAPVTAEFAEQIGAHGYASDAGQAASMAKAFVS